MIDFSTLKGLRIPEGVVTKIECGGVILWELQTSETVVLEVAKITSNTYAGSTQYNNESFVLLDIYPRSGGTVTVTYGGLTKTITDDGTSAEPNAQPVFFGTFNGVSDPVETPASGTLMIDGDCAAFGGGSYKTSSKSSDLYYNGVTGIADFGSISSIPDYAFRYCGEIGITEIPEGVETIGSFSFFMEYDSDDRQPITRLTTMTFPSTLKSIGDRAFAYNDTKGFPSVLHGVTMKTTTPPALGLDVFGQYGVSITVPAGCAEAYKAAESWSVYADYIVEASA